MGALPPGPQELCRSEKQLGPRAAMQSTIPSTDATSSMVLSTSESLTSAKMAAGAIRKLPGNKSTPKATPPTPAPVPVTQGDRGVEVNGQKNSVSVSEVGSPRDANPSGQEGSQIAAHKLTYPSYLSIANTPSNGLLKAPDAGVETSTRPKVPSPSPPFSRAIMSATEHPRSIIKSSASPPQQLPALEPPRVLLAPVFENQNHEAISSGLVVKACPEPSPPIAEMPGFDPREEVAEATRGIKTAAATTRMPTMPNTNTDQPKTKLVNPATRGPKIEMTASITVNAIVPALNGLSRMPPPPRTLMRPGGTLNLAQNKFGMADAVKEVTLGGPWSRESFDLFGPWRPPRNKDP